MGVEFLVRTQDLKIYQKGAISQEIKQAPNIWGKKECLPDFLVFRVTDATAEDILPYTQFWEIPYNITDEGNLTKIECPDLDKPNRAIPSQNQLDKFVSDLISRGVPAFGIVQHGTTHLTVDKSISTEQIRDILTDSFNDIHRHRRYTLNDNYIDSLVAAGNDLVEVTLEVFSSQIVDGAD